MFHEADLQVEFLTHELPGFIDRNVVAVWITNDKG